MVDYFGNRCYYNSMNTKTQAFNLLAPSGKRPAPKMSLKVLVDRGYVNYHTGNNKQLAEFNAYKHCFTNYCKLITTVHQSNLTTQESLAAIKHIYIQLSQQVETHYRDAVNIAYKMSCANYYKRCESYHVPNIRAQAA
jgi:hypothetical protein